MSRIPLIRRLAVILLAAFTAVLAVGAAPAQASIPSGAGWSASWRYYAADGIEFTVTLPGVKAFGNILDLNGQRTVIANVTDTADDDRCAMVVVTDTGPGVGGSGTACANGETVSFSAADTLDGAIAISIYRMYMFDSGADKSSSIVIPASLNDPGLRTVDTGASWQYTSGTLFSYALRRTGVEVTGSGGHSGDTRTTYSVLRHKPTRGGATCVTGKVSGPGAPAKSTQTCTTGDVVSFAQPGFTQYIKLEACTTWTLSGEQHCIATNVIKPV